MATCARRDREKEPLRVRSTPASGRVDRLPTDPAGDQAGNSSFVITQNFLTKGPFEVHVT